MKAFLFYPAFLAVLMVGCGGDFIKNSASSVSSVSSNTLDPGEAEPAVRVVFNAASFSDLNDFVALPSTSFTCVGDLLRVYDVKGDDYTGTPTAFPTPTTADALLPTRRPAFLKNVSVDLTRTYYPTVVPDTLASDGCSFRENLNAPLPGSCADFDVKPTPTPAPTIAPTPMPTPLPVPTTTPTTNQYFQTGFYRVRDDWCADQGPVLSPDPDVTKSLVGGVNIDLDREQLGSHEDLLLTITYHALGENSDLNNWPAPLSINPDTGVAIPGTSHSEKDRTILKVHLMGTQESLASLLFSPQPRAWSYSNPVTYPVYLKDVATLEDPFASIRTENIYIPLSQAPLADRIRIERVRGSYHLFQIDLYRLGNRAE